MWRKLHQFEDELSWRELIKYCITKTNLVTFLSVCRVYVSSVGNTLEEILETLSR